MAPSPGQERPEPRRPSPPDSERRRHSSSGALRSPGPRSGCCGAGPSSPEPILRDDGRRAPRLACPPAADPRDRQGRNRPVRMRRKQQSTVSRSSGCAVSTPVVDVPGPGLLQGPKPIEGRGAHACKQLPVLQQRDIVGLRRRKCVQSAARLHDAGSHRPPQCGVVNAQAGEGRPPGRSSADGQSREDIHELMIRPAKQAPRPAGSHMWIIPRHAVQLFRAPGVRRRRDSAARGSEESQKAAGRDTRSRTAAF